MKLSNKIMILAILWIGMISLPLRAQRNAKEMPALLPLPQSVKWTGEQFLLDKCKTIVVNDAALMKVANVLQQMLEEKGFATSVKQGILPGYTIQLKLGKVPAPYLEEEAYQLKATKQVVTLTANTPHGIFNGIQTLYQLIQEGRYLQGVAITDYPAYKWRGYMVDAGRNYHSITLLKQQIDIMSRYKLNVFHFHLTEDVAWRLQILSHPELTAAEHMTRNKGQFYSIAEMKDLIQYCKDRFITLVPEIDIPGHSAAFKRATGVDMQSEKGSKILLDIVNEVCSTYDIPYLHIGADEVEIINADLLPDLSRAIRAHDKAVITWAPGGVGASSTIRQLWKEEHSSYPNAKYIDSRFLYLSDTDPLNSVVTIFNRQLGGKEKGDADFLGAEICLWSDRRVAKETDLLTMTAVYPSMLAFSERSWRGGGYPGILFSMGADTSVRAKEFARFEKRLIAHKRSYFTQLPFTYVKQADIHWKLFGPFENKGVLDAAYWPEQQAALEDSVAPLHVTGGTIWLRHTHGPAGVFKTKAWVPDPRENTTWYAFTRFWSDADTTIAMWVETKNLSRSGADATPPAGQWDYMKSKIWLNGALIPPPEWAFPGRSVGQLEEPMVDEGFYYRPPVRVPVKKGWNRLLVKLPMEDFDPNKDWQLPPKWMFTVIPVHQEEGINWYGNKVRFEPGK